jgi:PPK2 family polyphosphate:nucleotide phosphotransferase
VHDFAASAWQERAVKKIATKLCERYRIEDGKGFRLKDVDPRDTAGLGKDFKGDAEALLAAGIDELADLQDKLYAQDRWALLLIFQAMDAAGKDGTIKHVLSGLNPQGCQVYSFKAPSTEELDHDFLWRSGLRLPERGRIGVFNRSYYEEVLVVRVHSELLERQRLPPELVDGDLWRKRYQDIKAYERHLARSGTVIRKFFLHVSKEEQRRRFLDRLEEPEKNWKFSADDVAERRHWKEYQHAYEDAIRATATRHAPWYVVPADNKWFTRLVVAAAVAKALKEMRLSYPKVDREKRRSLRAARRELLGKDDGLDRRKRTER